MVKERRRLKWRKRRSWWYFLKRKLKSKRQVMKRGRDEAVLEIKL